MSKAKVIIILAAILLLMPIGSGCAKPPVIAFSQSSFSFSAEQGGSNPMSQTLDIWNSGAGMLSWSVSSGASWLHLSPNSGAPSGESDSVTLSVDIAGMDAGNYAAVITISASGASNSPQTIPVNLSITTTSTEASPSSLLMTDSVQLAVYDKEANMQFWLGLGEDDEQRDESFMAIIRADGFNYHGQYRSKPFYVMESEVINITMKSSIPISTSHEFEEGDGYLNAVLTYTRKYGLVCPSISKTVTLQRVEDGWELTGTYVVEQTGELFVNLINCAYEPCWCEYTISLRQ